MKDTCLSAIMQNAGIKHNLWDVQLDESNINAITRGSGLENVDVKMFLVLETSGKTAADRCYYFLFSL